MVEPVLEPTAPRSWIAEEREAASLSDFVNTVKQRRRYATYLLWVLIGQIVLANVIFGCVAWFGYRWKMPVAAVATYLGSMVVETIGLVFVVVQYLFPATSKD